MKALWAQTALTAQGWQEGVTVEWDGNGRITRVEAGTERSGSDAGILLPAPANLHSHAFQRAMAGLTERRGPDPRDTFWTWRELMFRFLDRLTPADMEAIAAFVQMEMLEAGFAAVCEFHYVHHRPGGEPYDDVAEMSGRIAAAAARTGIGLTLLPVLYRQGGCDGRPLAPGQIRFGSTHEQFTRLAEAARKLARDLGPDANCGVAPHSLRAVSAGDLDFCVGLMPEKPLHMHLAEQVGEVEEVMAFLGAAPGEWLLANQQTGPRWCLIHCTQMSAGEIDRLAATGAVTGLCPITESSLGDGIFEAVALRRAGGRFGVGSDSNIRISLAEELRTLEYSQRLRDRARAVLATPERSTGRVLFAEAALGGAQAAGRASGEIAPGKFADLVALDANCADLAVKTGDDILDAWIFAGDNRMVGEVWSAGRHVVSGGVHRHRDEIVRAYIATMKSLKERV